MKSRSKTLYVGLGCAVIRRFSGFDFIETIFNLIPAAFSVL